MINFSVRKSRLKTDLPLILVTALLLFTGLLVIYEATPGSAFRDFGDKLYYFKNQLLWAAIGAISLAFLSLFDYHKLVKMAPMIFGTCLILLVAVLIPGIGSKIYGARRWISIAGFTFQPSEIAKMALILYSTSIISKFENYKIKLLDALTVIFVPAFVATVLVLLEPDLGTALIFLAIIISVYFIGKGPLKHF